MHPKSALESIGWKLVSGGFKSARAEFLSATGSSPLKALAPLERSAPG